MLKLKDINKIRKLHSLGKSKRAISKITGVSRNTVTKYINCPDEVPVSKKPGRVSPLTPYTSSIKEIFLKCGGNCELAKSAILEKLGLEVQGRNLRRFCHPWRAEAKKVKEREFKRLQAKYRIHRSRSKTHSVGEPQAI